MKIHKAGPQKVAMYIGLGRYEYVPTPLYDDAKVVYEGTQILCACLCQ